jgi:UrcA family protein
MTTLTTRVEHAAHALCNDRDHSVDLASRTASVTCYTTAVAGAMKQVPVAAPQFASR